MRIGTPLSPSATRVMLLGSGELGKEVIIARQRLGVEVIAVDRYERAKGHILGHLTSKPDQHAKICLNRFLYCCCTAELALNPEFFGSLAKKASKEAPGSSSRLAAHHRILQQLFFADTAALGQGMIWCHDHDKLFSTPAQPLHRSMIFGPFGHDHIGFTIQQGGQQT